jgi:hypothetical protein
VPVPLEDVLVEDAEATRADTHGVGGELIDGFAGQEVVLELWFGDAGRGFAVELSQETDLTDIGWWSTLTRAAELKCSNHLLTQRGHAMSPCVS